jgi:Mn2+/Fe2+ NRAMP family transporter
MRKGLLIVAVLLSLPILLHVYQPSMRLESFGLLLGIIGMTVSPLILFASLAYLVYREWR